MSKQVSIWDSFDVSIKAYKVALLHARKAVDALIAGEKRKQAAIRDGSFRRQKGRRVSEKKK